MEIKIGDYVIGYGIECHDNGKNYNCDREISNFLHESLIFFQQKLVSLGGVIDNTVLDNKVIFEKLENAQNALEWAESLYIMNKLTGENKNIYYKLQPGPNKIRILGALSEIKFHLTRVANGVVKREKCDGENCPLCTIGHTNMTNYEMDIIDSNDEIKVLEIGKRLMEQLCHAARDYSDITQHDITIKRFGTGIDTQYLISIGG